MFEAQPVGTSPGRGTWREPQGFKAVLTSSETAGVEPFRDGGGGTFGMVSVTVLVWSTAVVETVNDGGGVEVGGGVVAGGSLGVDGGSFVVTGSGAGAGSAGLVAELEVAGGDDGAGVDDVVPLAGVCVVVGDVVPPAAGVVEDFEPDGFEEVFGAGAAAVVLALEARAGLAGTTVRPAACER